LLLKIVLIAYNEKQLCAVRAFALKFVQFIYRHFSL